MSDDSTLHTFESQLGAFLRGYLVGHSHHATSEEIFDAVVNSMCPHCLAYWGQKRDQCCVTHALENFMTDVYQDSMLVVEVAGGASPHGDPTLN